MIRDNVVTNLSSLLWCHHIWLFLCHHVNVCFFLRHCVWPLYS